MTDKKVIRISGRFIDHRIEIDPIEEAIELLEKSLEEARYSNLAHDGDYSETVSLVEKTLEILRKEL